MTELTLERRVSLMEDEIRAVKSVAASQADAIARYRIILHGDLETESPGALKRIGTLEKIVENTEREKAALKNRLAGMAFAVGFAGVTSAGTFVTLLNFITGGIAKP